MGLGFGVWDHVWGLGFGVWGLHWWVESTNPGKDRDARDLGGVEMTDKPLGFRGKVVGVGG